MAVSFGLEPAPYSTALVTKFGTMSAQWVTWFLLLLTRLGATPLVFKPPVALLNQHAAIGVTALVASAKAGTYRISWHTRITTIDGVASSVAVNVQSVEGGAAVSQVGTALTSDTLNAALSGSVIATVDAGSLLSYSTSYSSTTPNAMGYGLTIVTEQMT